MAIVKRPAGEATLYGQAAAITGKAIAAQRTLEAAKEQHREARRMEAEERAHQWEVEKMDMRSRMDFAEQEGRRQEKRANLQAAIKRIDEIDTIPDSTKEKLKTKAILEFHQVSLSDRALGLIPETDEREKVPSRTDVGAALKFMTEFKEKEKEAEAWYAPFAPDPTAEERAAVPYYQDILQKAGMGAGEAGRAAVSMAPVEQDVNINVRPNSEEEFKSIVSQLKAVDPTKAQAYFDKYIGAFEW